MKTGAVPPCTLVIFGATGDLSSRKLLPALYHLLEAKLLPADFRVVGISRPQMSVAAFRRFAASAVRRGAPDAKKRRAAVLARELDYRSADLEDPATFAALARELRGSALFYMAVGPRLFAPIAEGLAAAGLLKEDGGYRRMIVEKPFGRDLASARALNARLRAVAREEQIYRIDHYLGKETVQNLLMLRFGNAIFEPVWNRQYIDHVQITVAEQLGVERRGRYYDAAGALRDMVPNHIFQLISLLAMEPPASFDADAVRDEQAKVLRALEPPERGRVVFGQYRGYRAEPNVARSSRTETFVAMKLFVENWRWAGIPFVFRTGKKLPFRTTELVVQFRRAPLRLFAQAGVASLSPNQIVVRIQPNEGIELDILAKEPGPAMVPGRVALDFRYEDYFGRRPSTGYERLLHDAMTGDQTLFRRADLVEAGWGCLDRLVREWERSRARPRPYAPGTWGPKEADDLLGRDWRRWRECLRF